MPYLLQTLLTTRDSASTALDASAKLSPEIKEKGRWKKRGGEGTLNPGVLSSLNDIPLIVFRNIQQCLDRSLSNSFFHDKANVQRLV